MSWWTIYFAGAALTLGGVILYMTIGRVEVRAQSNAISLGMAVGIIVGCALWPLYIPINVALYFLGRYGPSSLRRSRYAKAMLENVRVRK